MTKDCWRVVEPVPTNNFQGLTELRRGNRTVACVGVGDAVEAKILARFREPAFTYPEMEE